MNTQYLSMSSREAAIRGLAVVGFLALVALGMWLAIYSARFVPATVSRFGAAAVSLSQIFTPGPSGTLVVVPTATTTPLIEEPVSTTPIATAPASSGTVSKSTAGSETNGTYPIAGTGKAPLSGLPDLTIKISAVGYLVNTSTTTSFVASPTVPAGSRAAVQFTIMNAGTNVAGMWRFSASIPTSSGYLFQSAPQQALNPGDSIDYTLGFDQANPGSQTISVNANFDRVVTESNTNNNTASASLGILGS